MIKLSQVKSCVSRPHIAAEYGVGGTDLQKGAPFVRGQPFPREFRPSENSARVIGDIITSR
jgi:hypothetical protein